MSMTYTVVVVKQFSQKGTYINESFKNAILM